MDIIICSGLVFIFTLIVLYILYKNLNKSRGTSFSKVSNEIKERYQGIKNLKEKSPYLHLEEKDESILILSDLFVEKDIKALEHRSKIFLFIGICLMFSTLLIFSFTAYTSYTSYSDTSNTKNLIKETLSYDTNNTKKSIKISTSAYIPIFVKSFTFYGLMILIGATAWKLSKAFMDQAERLLFKRRTDRLLRLYIHLNDAKISIDEMKEILDLGDYKNAFTDIKAEAKAPWGNVISELFKMNTEMFKDLSHNIPMKERRLSHKRKTKRG